MLVNNNLSGYEKVVCVCFDNKDIYLKQVFLNNKINFLLFYVSNKIFSIVVKKKRKEKKSVSLFFCNFLYCFQKKKIMIYELFYIIIFIYIE